MKPALLFLLLAGVASLTPACHDASRPADSRKAPEEALQGPASILLISIDTTRADHLGCYGRHPSPTPHIDRLASEGVVFERAMSTIPITLPAHTTLLTGLLPHRHGVRDNGIYRVPDDLPALPARLAEAGYDTAAVVAAAVLDRQYGLARGFRIYNDVSASSGGLEIAERDAREVTDAALATAARLEPPFFLFVHYFDPHAVYDPPPPFADRYRSDPYLGEIAFVDSEIGRLRESLEARGLLRGGVVGVISDHGEGRGEHDEATHGVFLYQSTLHVPLIIAAPGRWPAGLRISGAVSLADVAPTLLDLAGAPGLDGVDGRSLSAAVRGETAERWLPLESEFGLNSYGWAPLVGLTDGRLKWVGAPRPELYDLTRDPREDDNLAPRREDDVRRLSGLWRKRVTEDRRSLPGSDRPDRAAAEQLERLRALGYVAGSAGSRPEDGSELPNPREAIASLRLVNEARGRLNEGRLDEAQRLLERALGQSPGNVSALVLLGVTHLMAGRAPLALEPLQRASGLAPANAEVQVNLGLAMAGAGNALGAERAFRRALELAPRTHDAAVNLVDLLVNTGRPDEAWAALQAARGQGLESPQIDFLEGKLAAARGDQMSAHRLLRRAVAGGLPPAAVDQARAILRSLSAGRTATAPE